MKAMILAAGRGNRLRPLTDNCPKPLLPIAGRPLIVHLIQSLAASGFTEIVVNIAYQPARFLDVLGDGSRYGVAIHYSLEPEGGLETGGGIFKALDHLGDTFLVVSGDLYTSYPYHTLRKAPERMAHLVMVDPLENGGDFGLKNGIISLKEPNMFTYGNIGVYRREFFQGCQPGFFPLVDLLRPAIAREEVTGEHFRGSWHNVGTVEIYDALNLSCLSLG